jgi:hypothetical protein
MQLLKQSEAATALRLSERSLERMRLQGAGPLFVKAGRSVRYRLSDLETWIAARVVASTSECAKSVYRDRSDASLRQVNDPKSNGNDRDRVRS